MSVARERGSPNSNRQERTAILTVERTFSPEHYQVLRCARRHRVVVSGRRWGKTTLGLWELMRDAFSTPHRRCYYIAPTERQAKEIAWRILKHIVVPAMRQSIRESELEIQLINGSILKLHGPESLRGAGLDFAVLDEYADMPVESWEEVVWPMLADRQGRALFIGTPKGRQNHFYELCLDAQFRPDWAAFHFRTEQGGYISGNELALLRSQMDSRRYAQKLEASFHDLRGRVYHAFCPQLNVRDIAMHPDVNLLIGMDFNIDPMTAVIAQRAGEACHVGDEIILRNSNTQLMMQELNRRYPGRAGVVNPQRRRQKNQRSSRADRFHHHWAGWLACLPDEILSRGGPYQHGQRNAVRCQWDEQAVHQPAMQGLDPLAGRTDLQGRNPPPR